MDIQEILNEKIIERNFYSEKISKYFNSPLIKVLVWQRRVWKSTILKSVIQKFFQNWEENKGNFLEYLG